MGDTRMVIGMPRDMGMDMGTTITITIIAVIVGVGAIRGTEGMKIFDWGG